MTTARDFLEELEAERAERTGTVAKIESLCTKARALLDEIERLATTLGDGKPARKRRRRRTRTALTTAQPGPTEGLR